MLHLERRGCIHCFASIAFAAIAISSARAQSVLLPSDTRRDLVFDHSGQHLYISNSNGIVQTYNLWTQQFGTNYNLGGSLNGLDIARDDSFLLVAQGATTASEGTFHKVALVTGIVTNINYTLDDLEAGAWDVAIGSNGLALVTSQCDCKGWVHLRQIDLTTNAISIRSDALGSGFDGEVFQDTQIHRSADGSQFFLIESLSNVFTFSASHNTFKYSVDPYGSSTNTSGAVSRNGGLIALRTFRPVSLNAFIDFNFVHSFTDIDGGVAFDAVSDTFYGVNTATDEIIAYSAQTFAELFRLIIGEDMPSGATQFGVGVLVASADGHWLALETPLGVRLFSLPESMPTPSPTATPIPSIPPGGNLLVPSVIRRDLVFDSTSQNLYISNSTGTVRAFSLSSFSFGTTYELGGTLNGLDISGDNTSLLVAQAATSGPQGTFHKIDLTTGMVTDIHYTLAPGEIGAWDVAIGSNDLALATTRFSGSGWVPLHQIDLTTNAISARSDVPGSGPGGEVDQDTEIHRSVDRSRLFFMEASISSGPIFTYSANSNTFGPSVKTGAFLSAATGAVNRNGSLTGLRTYQHPAILRTAPDLNFVHNFNAINGGVTFDASSDLFYGVNTTSNQIIAYSTDTFAERFRLNIGETMPSDTTPFGTGVLVASADGAWLALETPAGIRLFPVSGPHPTPSPTPGGSPTPTGTPSPSAAQTLNISTRMRVDTGSNVLIGGFIVTGTVSKNVALRALGPSLSAVGISDALADPSLELHGSNGALILANDDWGSDPIQSGQLTAFGLALQNPKESGLVITIPPSSYTAIVSGINQTSGVGLMEVYDTNSESASQLGNISTRGLVLTESNVMIGGFILGGSSNTHVVVRGIGPSLAQSGITDFLADPILELHDSNGVTLLSNDNWPDDPSASQLIELGLAPQNAAESGIYTSLAPGAFTAILAGTNGGIGIGLVEIYNVH